MAGNTTVRSANSLRQMVMSQLPRLLQMKLSITSIETDAYHLGTHVVFTDPKTKREWDTRLELAEIDGALIACVLPPWFIDHLCASA